MTVRLQSPGAPAYALGSCRVGDVFLLQFEPSAPSPKSLCRRALSSVVHKALLLGFTVAEHRELLGGAGTDINIRECLITAELRHDQMDFIVRSFQVPSFRDPSGSSASFSRSYPAPWGHLLCSWPHPPHCILPKDLS